MVYWKAIFFTLPRNKTGIKFTLIEIMSSTSNDCNAETLMYCAMVVPHLILAKTRTEDGASNNKIIARRLDRWVRWDIYSLFFEAKPIKKRMSRTKTKRYVDEYKEYKKNMSTGRISIAIRSLTEKAKGGVLSLTDKVDKKTVLDVLRKKHPEP